MTNPDTQWVSHNMSAANSHVVQRAARGRGRVTHLALLLCLVPLALLSSCANTDPFFIYRAHDGRVLVSHEELDPDLAVKRYGLESLDWEEFAAEPRYLYLWSAGDVDRALSAKSSPMESGFCEFTADTGR